MGDDNVEQPLLEKKYYEDCPGCKVDRAKELSQGKGVLIRNLVIIWMVGLCSGNLSTPFSVFFYLFHKLVVSFLKNTVSSGLNS